MAGGPQLRLIDKAKKKIESPRRSASFCDAIISFHKASMSMITATTWVPRGFAAPFPTKYEFDEDEYDRISKLANLQLEDAKEELEEAQAEAKNGTGSAGKESKAEENEYVF